MFRLAYSRMRLEPISSLIGIAQFGTLGDFEEPGNLSAVTARMICGEDGMRYQPGALRCLLAKHQRLGGVERTNGTAEISESAIKPAGLASRSSLLEFNESSTAMMLGIYTLTIFRAPIRKCMQKPFSTLLIGCYPTI